MQSWVDESDLSDSFFFVYLPLFLYKKRVLLKNIRIFELCSNIYTA